MAYKTGNPALNANTFNNLDAVPNGEVMTLEGTTNKTFLMLALAFFGAYCAGNEVVLTVLDIWIVVPFILGFILSLVIIFFKKTAPFLAPIYAVLEGFILGFISLIFEKEYNGIVIQALLLTTGIFVSMLVLYRTRVIQATENLRLGIFAATGGIALYYLANFIAGFFGISLPLITDNSIYGIIFTLIVVAIAAFNLVLDFDFIEAGVEQRAPKYMEWYASFGLFITMVWLYVEVLRLLGKSRRS